MRLLTQKSEFRYSFIVFAVVFFLIAVLTILYWLEVVTNPKLVTLISGLLTGFVIVAFQTWLSWVELIKLDEYNELKIIKILHGRDDREYYERLISAAEKNISVLGVTAQRFLEHFANEQNSRVGAKVLLEALGKGVMVKILIASPDELTDEKDKNKANLANPYLRQLKEKFKDNFDYAYFKHQPVHSIFTVDDESIVGPVFPGVNSEYTPAIHLRNDSKFVTNYLKYFEGEWKKWGNEKESTN
ncbi:MAG: hypothetical protein K8F24_07005 [Bacteroidales bacterium]|nr:hypothetical protein [Bacteroidales bacterium]